MVRLLAEQLPSLDPRAKLCYHPLTLGWYATKLSAAFPAKMLAISSAQKLAQSIWGNPPHFARETFPWNEPAMHRAKIPAARPRR
jgi:hypothetical protein